MIYLVYGGWFNWFVLVFCNVICGNGIELFLCNCINFVFKYGGIVC